MAWSQRFEDAFNECLAIERPPDPLPPVSVPSSVLVTSKALVTRSDALVPSSVLVTCHLFQCHSFQEERIVYQIAPVFPIVLEAAL